MGKSRQSLLLTLMNSDIWGLRKIQHVVDNDKDTKLVVLDPRVKLDDTNSLSESGRSYIAEHGISLQPYTANINYDYWTAGMFCPKFRG